MLNKEGVCRVRAALDDSSVDFYRNTQGLPKYSVYFNYVVRDNSG